MNRGKRLARLGRREFLRVAGLAAGAALLPPSTACAAGTDPDRHWPVQSGAIRVGVLLPGTSLYPALGANLVAGLSLGLERAGVDAQLLETRTSCGLGAAQQACAKLLGDGHADLVLAVLNPSVAAGLRPLFAQAQRPLIVADAGADVLRVAQRDPWIYYHT